MSRTFRQQLGARGEQLAREFLEKEGYSILQTNFRFGHGEVDLVVSKEDVLAFVEVKSYFSPPLEAPELRVNRAKRRKMVETAIGFLERWPQFENYDLRFDVIIVDFSQYPAAITHYPGAFWPERF